MTRETQPLRVPTKNRLSRRVLSVTAVIALAVGSPCAVIPIVSAAANPPLVKPGTEQKKPAKKKPYTFRYVPTSQGTRLETLVNGKVQKTTAKRSRNGVVKVRASGKRGSDSYTKLVTLDDNEKVNIKSPFPDNDGLN